MPDIKRSPSRKALTQAQFQARLRALSGQIKKHQRALDAQVKKIKALEDAVEDLIPLVPPGKGASAKTASQGGH
ncbi:MAG: hypothetical protein LW835_13870 [Burkholderiaceae bacterium]|jgi:hypothetical protein|nr:hypothetical protein [Burkholderiaceae bacterium]